MVKSTTGAARQRIKFQQRADKCKMKHVADSGIAEDRSLNRPAKLSKKAQTRQNKRARFLVSVAKSSLATKKAVRKRRRGQKLGALGTLHTLAESLKVAELESTDHAIVVKKRLTPQTAKGRQKLSSQETIRLQQVMANPHFQKDPFAAVAGHLDAILPSYAPTAAPAAVKKELSRGQRQKHKKLPRLTAKRST